MPLRFDPHRRHPAKTLAVVCAVAVAAFVAVYWITVRTTWGQTIEDRALLGRELVSSGTLDAIHDELGTISVLSLGAAGLLLIVVGLVRRRVALAAGVGVMILGANITTRVLKHTLARPDLTGASGEHPSFPSGHATVAMSVVMACMLVVPPWARALTAVVGQAYATTVGVGVVGAGWHRPGDSIGAYLVCLAWSTAVAAVLSGHGAKRVHRPESPWAVAAIWTGRVVLVGGGVVVSGALWATSLLDLSLSRADVAAGNAGDYYAAAGNLITFAGLLCLTLLLLPLRGVDLGGRGAAPPRALSRRSPSPRAAPGPR